MRQVTANTVEGSWILRNNPALRSRTAAMLTRFLPTFKAMIDRQRPKFQVELEKLRQSLRSGSLLSTYGVRLLMN
jgi:hypothetical protein